MNSQNVRAALSKQLPIDEATVLYVYDDAVYPTRPVKKGDTIIGNLTIGTGRNVMGKGISIPEAKYLNDNDISDVFSQLDKTYPWWETLPDFAAYVLANMTFNMGLGKIGGFPKFLAAMKANDWNTATAEMTNSAWFNQTGDRAKRLVTIMKNGILSPM